MTGGIDIDVDILPHSNMAPPLLEFPEIITSMGTGTTTVKINSPIPFNRAKIRSSHVGASGATSIFHPEEWEGIISGQAQVGSVDMWGKGLEVIEERNNRTGFNVYVKAIKGNEPWYKADTVVELRGGPITIGIGKRTDDYRGKW